MTHIFENTLWYNTWTCENIKSLVLKEPLLYPWHISLRTTYDTIHGLVKISSLKFLKSLSGHHWSHQQGLPRTHASTYTLTNIYAKISSLKFFKGPSHIHQRYYIWETPMIQQCSKTQTSKSTCICLENEKNVYGLVKISSLKFLKSWASLISSIRTA